ncbi:MAG: undecaprenyldiphospho-muramoylpentapeptide beta-N-acetylglucosaminyltransferase [Alphaproteobacteria bacterium]|nr:undecaprenyldiphospho-muramoylpentapeptide beta-N-acetylglucosaminyltransferase [Alphaproteobacteria bacterium]
MAGPVVIAAGGTGGHIFPAQSLAQELAKRGVAVVLMTDDRGQNYAQTFPQAQIVTVPSATFAGRGAVGKAFAVARLARGAVSAFFKLGRVKPSVVVGFGGYPALPTMFAAARRGLPCVIHEQNAVLGRVNRWLSPSVTKIAAAFEKLTHLEPVLQPLVTVTGNPVRPAVIAAARPFAKPASDGRFNLLVFGGSQGARVFATLVPEAIAKLPEALRKRLDLTQQCRPEDLEAAKARYAAIGLTPTLASFFTDMGERLASAHLVISRAGASTVTELCAVGRPSILIPYPFAMDDHQTVNAGQLADAGAAWTFKEAGLSADMLAAKVTELAEYPVLLEAAAAKALSLGRRDAASRLADLVEEVGGLKARS